MVRTEKSGCGAVELGAACLELRQWQKRAEQKGFVLPTGYGKLDKYLGGGLLPGGLYVIGARPAMGKTQFGLNLANKLCEGKGTGLIISMEMTTVQITARLLGIHSGLSAGRILMQSRDLTQEEWQKLNRGSSELLKRKLAIADGVSTLPEIETTARSIPGLTFLVIDYLGLIRSPGSRASRYEKLTEISGDLKRLAKRLGIPILLLAQLNRELAGRTDHRPQLSDLRDTGAVEQDADAVLLLHREDYYRKKSEETKVDDTTPVLLEVLLAKNRFGPTGTINMSFYLKPGRILNG